MKSQKMSSFINVGKHGECFEQFLPLWSVFTSKLVHGLAFGTSKFYIAPYDKINHELLSLSYNYDVKSGLSL